MGLFGDEVLRLLREKWASPQQLAEELYVILSANVPLNVTGPVTITNPTSQPGLTVTNTGPPTTPGITINRQPLPAQPAFPPLPGAPPFLPGTFETTNITVENRGGTAQQSQGQGSSTFPGKVVSGKGKTYKVDVYTAGIKSVPARVNVTQLQIDPTETIPAGTWALVAKVGGNFFMQVPVWS